MNLNLILTKTVKFVTFVFFSFAMLVYFGTMLVLPLDIMFQIARLLEGLGLPSILAVAGGGAAVGYLGYTVWKMPSLTGLVFDIGTELIAFGHRQVGRFDELPEVIAARK